MAPGLDKLVSSLYKIVFKIQANFMMESSLIYLREKGVYPYDHINSHKRLNEKELHTAEKFYLRLIDENISDDDYEHAKKVRKDFKMNTFRDYHDLYNQSGVSLLADVFFRDICIKNYEIDPAWYCAAPGIAWDAALKKTKVKLDLLTDPGTLFMFEKVL